jgi:hypothetical protein
LNCPQVELRRGNLDTMWGFSVEAELVENSEKQDELCCYVSRVEERSVAMNSGKKGQLRANYIFKLFVSLLFDRGSLRKASIIVVRKAS